MCEPADLNACSDRGTCTEEGFCNCDVGYFGDYCQFPEICDLVNDRGGPHTHNADQKFGMPRDTDEEICLMPNGLLHESYFKVFQEGLSTNDVNRENFFEKLK